MNIGTEFEHELSREFGLKRVPGSGNQSHSKLDLTGNGFRWSLKATTKLSASIRSSDIEEAIGACFGINGTGETPLWAYRVGGYDLVMMRKEDFVALAKGDLKAVSEPVGKEKVLERRRRSDVPQLLRDLDGD